jgi:hypothetical protein
VIALGSIPLVLAVDAVHKAVLRRRLAARSGMR